MVVQKDSRVVIIVSVTFAVIYWKGGEKVRERERKWLKTKRKRDRVRERLKARERRREQN